MKNRHNPAIQEKANKDLRAEFMKRLKGMDQKETKEPPKTLEEEKKEPPKKYGGGGYGRR